MPAQVSAIPAAAAPGRPGRGVGDDQPVLGRADPGPGLGQLGPGHRDRHRGQVPQHRLPVAQLDQHVLGGHAPQLGRDGGPGRVDGGDHRPALVEGGPQVPLGGRRAAGPPHLERDPEPGQGGLGGVPLVHVRVDPAPEVEGCQVLVLEHEVGEPDAAGDAEDHRLAQRTAAGRVGDAEGGQQPGEGGRVGVAAPEPVRPAGIAVGAQVGSGGRVRLSGPAHAGADQPLEVLVSRHDPVLRRVARPAPQQPRPRDRRTPGDPRSGSVPPFASPRAPLGWAIRGWALDHRHRQLPPPPTTGQGPPPVRSGPGVLRRPGPASPPRWRAGRSGRRSRPGRRRHRPGRRRRSGRPRRPRRWR
jgi:hypothetical protein